MIDRLASIGAAEVATRILDTRGRNRWFVLVAPRPILAGLADDLASEIELVGRSPVIRLKGPQLLEKLSQQPTSVVLVQVDEDTDWRALDLGRSVLEREAPVVLLTEPRGAGTLFASAPNLASWIGGRAWRIDPDADLLSAAEVESRLAHLRAHFGMDEATMIARLQQGELAPGPEVAEWLVLIGRGDLLG